MNRDYPPPTCIDRRLVGIPTGMATPPPNDRPDPPNRSGSVTDCYPGFCSRCDRHALVRLAAGAASLDALCPACRSAEKQDRARGRLSAAWKSLRPAQAR